MLTERDSMMSVDLLLVYRQWVPGPQSSRGEWFVTRTQTSSPRAPERRRLWTTSKLMAYISCLGEGMMVVIVIKSSSYGRKGMVIKFDCIERK